MRVSEKAMKSLIYEGTGYAKVQGGRICSRKHNLKEI